MVPSFLISAALVQRDPSVWSREEIVSAASNLSTGLAVAILVYWLVPRAPWPRPFRLRFLALHVVAAPLAAFTWLVASSAVQWLFLDGSLLWRIVAHVPEMLLVGVIFYTIVAGISYAVASTARAARAEALAARTQLAALRAQLQPHFLFNALHTVVQLIPMDPARATEAAELVADLLRTTLEEQRDEVTLADEWRFVSRYLAVERIRFGDRLVVRAELPEALLDEWVPAYALQTLVENAVRHGAAPRVAATEIVVTAAASARELMLTVRDTGDAAPAPAAPAGSGTGLARLRERLRVLHGTAARLACGPRDGGGYEAVLVLPRHRGRAAA